MTAPLLLSKRKAAAMLGIGRGNTLEGLIRDGLIRTVIVAGKVRVPLAEVERIANEGTEAAPKPRPTKEARLSKRAASIAEEIGDIPL